MRRASTSRPTPARRAADRVRQGHAARPLPASGRNLSGPVRARRRGLRRRCRSRAARLRLHLEAVVHAGDAGAVERRHRPRPSDQLLSQQRRRQPRRRSSAPGTRMSGSRRKGGGIGTYWGRVRGIGEPVGLNGKTSGIIPFVRVMDSLTLAISQGSLRRGSAACYLDISHPEIEEFLEIRKPSGDFNRKALNLHHGVLVTDEFMEAVRDGAEFTLRSRRKDGSRARHGRRALAVPEAGRDPPRDRRAVHHLHRRGEQGDAQASPRPRPQGLDLEPLLGNHASDRQGPSRRRPHRGVLPVLAQPRDLGRVEQGQAVHRGRDALPRQCALRLYRPRARRDGARQVQRRARAQRRPRRDGLPLLPPGAQHPVRRGDGEELEPQDLQAYPRAGRRSVDDARQGARALPRRRRHGRDGALQLQDGDRADRVDLDHRRRHQRLHRADPGQHLHPQDLVGLLLDQEPVSREAARRQSRRTATRCGTRSSSRAARSSTSTS